MDASVSNLFSRGDKVIVCTAGKFGERWVEIAKAYGLDANVLKAEYGEVVTPDRIEAALKAEPATKGVFIQASETSTGAEHDVETIAGIVKKTDAIFVVDAITGHRHHAARYRRLGARRGDRRLAEGFHDSARAGVYVGQPKSVEVRRHGETLPHYYFNLKKEKKSGDAGESSWTPATSLILALGEALKYIKKVGMPNLIENAQLLAAHA